MIKCEAKAYFLFILLEVKKKIEEKSYRITNNLFLSCHYLWLLNILCLSIISERRGEATRNNKISTSSFFGYNHNIILEEKKVI